MSQLASLSPVRSLTATLHTVSVSGSVPPSSSLVVVQVQLLVKSRTMCSPINSVTELVCPTTSTESPSPGNLNMKKEADRRETFQTWSVDFIDRNHLAAIGFYFTEFRDVVRCAFCAVEAGHWVDGDDPVRTHKRLSPSCGFLRGLFVGNIPLNFDNKPETPSDSGPQIQRAPQLEHRPNSGPERCEYNNFYLFNCFFLCVNYCCKLIFSIFAASRLRYHNTYRWEGPMYPCYSTLMARVQSFNTWPDSSEKCSGDLSIGGFFYTGKFIYNFYISLIKIFP